MQSLRKSYSETGKIYFFTTTILQWKTLLQDDINKKLITDYLKELVDRELIKLYAFVIMPNHIHLIWQLLKKNGKETPQGSFLKYTAHELLKRLKQQGLSGEYEVVATNKRHEIWQKDPLSIEVYSREVARQKLEYIHFNPVSRKWKLSNDDLDYYYSSARFYENGIDEFKMLSNLYVEFDGE
ncbi:MAG: transposase [Ferruginibacter sp.]|nr:transposase [Ferruginibacter sp.]